MVKVVSPISVPSEKLSRKFVKISPSEFVMLHTVHLLVCMLTYGLLTLADLSADTKKNVDQHVDICEQADRKTGNS